MDNVDEIKKRIDIVDFIGQYLQLKKAGINYSALCPFHSEKTPSFMVSSERQSFKCFGCSEGGDVITFFMKMEGLSFPEALKILGERVGIQVELKPKEQIDREKTRRDVIYKVNLLSAKYFKATLWSNEGEKALKYLKSRGLDDDMIKKFKVGWAPGINKLEKYFKKYGFSASDVALAGHPERFKFRIIFPIFDVLGQIVGFSGRMLEEVLPQGFSPHPKYLNTPETPVFHKSRVLYGINLAKDAIRKTKRAVVVEGQMDVLLSHVAGIEEVVATSGTAITADHLKILNRYTQNIIFSFDEDEAGQKAAEMAVKLAYEGGIESKLTIIEKYKDVGELVLADKNAWPKIVEKALPPVEWLVKRVRMTKLELDSTGKKRLASQALGFVDKMQDEIEKSHYINYLAKVLAVPEVSVEKALIRLQNKKTNKTPEVQIQSPKRDLEADFIAFVINYPDVVKKTALDKSIEFDFKQYTQVYKEVLECYNVKEEIHECLGLIAKNLPREIREVLDGKALEWDQRFQESRDEAIAEYIAIKHNLSRRLNEQIKSDFSLKIAQAESEGDMEKVKELMIKLQKNLK